MERRKEARYALRVPVLFSWESTQPKQARAFARDISVSGAYILCERSCCPDMGDIVALEVILALIEKRGAQGMKLNFRGQVLRTGESHEESGFAVLAESAMELNEGRNSG